MKKRIFAAVLAVAAAVSLTACGNTVKICGDEYSIGDTTSLDNVKPSASKDIKGISKLENLESVVLDLSNVKIVDFKYLSGLENLQTLTIKNARAVTFNNFDAIGELPGLETLELSGFCPDDFSFLNNSVSLKKLVISGVSVDADKLASLTSLKTLVISDCDIDNVSALAGMTGLNNLSFGSIKNSSGVSISFLKSIDELQKLYLEDTYYDDVFDITQLKKLTIKNPGPYVFNDVDGIQAMTNLEYLNCEHNQLHSLEPLRELKNLKVLNLNNCRDSTYNSMDISPLSELTSLEELYLSGDIPQSCKPLAGLTGLKVLNIAGCNASNISFLSGMTQMEVLYLAGNQITDISTLFNMPKLRKLENLFSGNDISTSDAEKLNDALSDLDIKKQIDEYILDLNLEFAAGNK